MNVLFLTIGSMGSIEARGIYPDLLRQFRDRGHKVFVVSAHERRTGLPTELVEERGAKMLGVRIGNITRCNLVEKGISTVLIGAMYKAAIKKYFGGETFDLILYSTPPITLAGVVGYLKKRNGAKTYLLLKDIFPQNAVDIGMMSKSGVKGILYRFFRQKETRLYAVSDRIGCMSPANVRYVLQNNPEVTAERVEVCPNCTDLQDMRISEAIRREIRAKYQIPQDKTVFIYGGNLGRPQGIPALVQCLESRKNDERAFFLIVGDGTEYGKLESFIETAQPNNIKLMRRLQKEDYDTMVAACDVGMIFLDPRFTIPNFPSRLLSYMQAGLPTLCCTDPNSDVGDVAEQGGFGWKCLSDAPHSFGAAVDAALAADRVEMGEKAMAYLKEHYTSERAYEIIMKHMDRTE